MDVVADLLARARARGAVFANWTACAPWGMTFTDDVVLSFHAVLEGELWVQLADDAEPCRLLQGDVMLIAGGQTYAFTHERGAPAPITIDDMPERATRERTFEFGGPGAKTHVVCGAFTFEGSICAALLDALPPLVVVRGGEAGPTLRSVLGLLSEETRLEAPGQQTVLDRLLDLLLVYTLRAWFGSPDGRPPGWYSALEDPSIGAALRALHADPAHPWTVAELAELAGLSRAAFARRFAAATGTPPLSYLADWRIALAADALLQPGATLASVAADVGYANEFAFSAAFKRNRGMAPGKWRATRRAALATA
jgi:AraC-like DNA-binding protein